MPSEVREHGSGRTGRRAFASLQMTGDEVVYNTLNKKFI